MVFWRKFTSQSWPPPRLWPSTSCHTISPSPSHRVPINFSSTVRVLICYRFTSVVVQDTVHSSPLTTLIYCLYPACHIAYSAALCAPRSQNSLPGRSTVTTPAPHRPAGADFSSSAYTSSEVHSVSCCSVDIGGSFREGKAASMQCQC